MSEKNELMTLQQGTFTYNFQPAKVEINNYEKVVETAEMIAKHYDSLVLTNADLSEINETHRELNSFIKGLDEDRLKVKRDYNEPLKEFENKIKHVTELLNKPLQDIKNARDEILIKQEETRTEALQDYLKRQLKDSKVRIEDVEIPSSWTNKGNWTDKLNPRKPLADEIKHQIELVEEKYKKKIADREVLETFLDSKGMEHEGWTSQLEYREALDIIKEIQRTEEQRKQREAEKERIEQAEQLADERVEQVNNLQTTEIKLDRQWEEEITEEEIFVEIIEVTGTREQLNKLNDYMVTNGIKVAAYEPNPFDGFAETIDDLPF